MGETDQGLSNEGPWAETEIASARRASQRRGCWGWVIKSKNVPEHARLTGSETHLGMREQEQALVWHVPGSCLCVCVAEAGLRSLDRDLRMSRSLGRTSIGEGCRVSVVLQRVTLGQSGGQPGRDRLAGREVVHARSQGTRGTQPEDQERPSGHDGPQVSLEQQSGRWA